MRLFFLLVILAIEIHLPALQIGSIDFLGNRLFSEQELLSKIISYQGMEYDQKTALQDAERLAEFYESKGLYLAKVMLPEAVPQNQNILALTFVINEGPQLRIDSLLITGNNYILTSKLIREIKTPLQTLADLADFRRELVAYYNNNGFFFAEAGISSVNWHSSEGVAVTLQIDEGEFCRFDRHLVRGNKVTRSKTILQLSRLQFQKQITPQALEQAARNLTARPYINSCLIMPADATTLIYQIEEGAMTAFSGLIGYSNSSEKGGFTGYIDLEFQNLWGTDRSAGFFWDNRQKQHSAVQLNYHESGWDLPLGADVQLYRQEMDSTWIEVSYNLEAYWFDLFNKLGLYLEKENIYAGSRRPVIISEAEFYKTGAFWNYSTLDHPVNPQMGFSHKLKYYYIFSRSSEQDQGRQGAEIQYKRIFPLTSRWLIYGNININLIENKALTVFDKFEAGGANSIRGFLEKQFSGFRLSWMNLEFRYILNREARISINADLGNIENLKSGNQTVFSLGTGIMTATPLGLMSLDFAFPADENGFANAWEGIIHFGLETRF